MRRIYEKDIDQLLLRNLRSNPKFSNQLLALADIHPPGGLVPIVLSQTRHRLNSGSIDIEIQYGPSFVALIENKIDAGYSINQAGIGQADRYRKTKECLESEGCHAFSVLVAPKIYLESTRLIAKFDSSIAYECLLPLVIESDRPFLEAAIHQAATPYEPIPNTLSADFFRSFDELVAARYPSLIVKSNPNPDGVRPVGSHTIYFQVRKTLSVYPDIPTIRMSLQCWDKTAPSASVKIMIAGWGRYHSFLTVPGSLSDIGAYLRPAGQSLGIVIDTPQLDTQRPLNEQLENVVEGLESALRLQDWWSNSREVIRGWSELISQQIEL